MSKKRRERRRRLVADWKLQGALCLRVVVYWVICQVAIAITIFGFLALEGFEGSSSGSMPWRFLLPALVVSGAILPLALLDMLLFTNRLAGPLWRFRRHLQEFADGQPVEELRFRPGDMLVDLSQNINKIRSRERDQFIADDYASESLVNQTLCDPKGSQPTTVCN